MAGWQRRNRLLLLAALLAGALLPARSLTADDPPPPDLAALARRLDDPASRWLALWEIGELGPAAAPLVPRVAAALRDGHEVARRLAAEALGKIGASQSAATAALLQALPRARGAFEDALLRALERLGVGVAFRGELPEAITYASTPGLRALKQAYERKIVRADEVEWLRGCRAEAEAHARRLEHDRLFRLGEQTAANVAVSLQGRPGVEFVTHWSPPFLIVAVSAPENQPPATRVQAGVGPLRPTMGQDAQVEERMQAVAEVCQAVYRGVLTAHGARHDLRPLEDPWGGRADLPETNRSFSEGFPLQVWLVERPLFATGATHGVPITLPWGVEVFVDRERERLFVVPGAEGGARALPDAAAVGRGVAQSLLRAFRRQRMGWRERGVQQCWIDEALAVLWGAAERGPSGEVVIGAEPLRLAEYMGVVRQVVAHHSKSARDAPLGMTVGRLLAIERLAEASEWAGEAGVDPRLGPWIYRAEAVSFGLFLRDHASADRRAQLEAMITATLSDPYTPQTARRILRLRDEDDEQALDAEFQTWWRARLELPVVDPQPAGPR